MIEFKNKIYKVISSKNIRIARSDIKSTKLKFTFKISRLIKNLIEILTHSFTREFFYIRALKNASANKKINLKYLIKLVKSGHYIASYIPFIKGQTKAYIFNYFSTSYGLRSNGYLLLILVDSKFKLCCSKIVEFNFRKSLLIDIDEEFKNEEDYKYGSYFIGIQINKGIPINHGSNTWTARGGVNRFWGIWNESSSFIHSRYIPHPTKFIRNNIKMQQGKFLERLNYSKAAKKIVHYGPFSNDRLIEERGDLSGKIRLEPGYTIYFDEFNKVKAAFHQNYPFNSRFLRQKDSHPFIKHVIAIPPIKEIDIEMFFGECCSNGSKFRVEINQYTHSKEIISSSKIISIDNIDNSINLSQIFPKKEILGLGGWITFEAMDGKHDKKFINHIYKTLNKEVVFDSIHSHNFSKSFQEYGSRTLKFAPFHNKFIKNKNNSIESWIAIFGNEERNISTRIRLFNHDDCSFERIELFEIKPNRVTFINLNQILNNPIETTNQHNSLVDFDKFGICQIESEESNLSCNLYILKKENYRIKSLAVDHFTGG